MRDWKAEARNLAAEMECGGFPNHDVYIFYVDAIAVLCEKAYNDGYGAAMIRRADCCERYRVALEKIIARYDEQCDCHAWAKKALQEDNAFILPSEVGEL